MKIIYWGLAINFLFQFINNVKKDEKFTELIASILVFGTHTYFMLKIYTFIFN